MEKVTKNFPRPFKEQDRIYPPGNQSEKVPVFKIKYYKF